MIETFNELHQMDRAILIALIGLGLYAYFAAVDFIKTKWREK